MEYLIVFVVLVLTFAGLASLIEKKIVIPVADRLARKEWNNIVLRNMKRQRREMWEEQTISVAKSFNAERDTRKRLPAARIVF